ncbi:GyrI-like domain-containing protein [Salinimicrobium soli]|uniref:GyrI-like domain-containing protein n=1 Tax=Salinimicrobium soli TaxID=1254399 RepID=UPI003AAADF9A
MKIIKYLLFLILILIIAGSIYIATKDGDYSVESNQIINAPAPMLYREIADLSNWQTWEGWSEVEGIEMNLSDKTVGEGAELNWKADEIRDGKITTVSAIPYSQLDQQLIMKTSLGQAEGIIHWTIRPEEKQTLVSWKMAGTLTFKEKLAFALQDRDMAEIFKPIFESSLKNIEENVTRKMEEYSINVDGVTEHGGGYYMYTTTAARFGEVNSKAANMIEQVSIYMEKNNISISGQPFVIYNQRDERNGTTIFSAAVPTPSQVITPSGSEVLNGYLQPQKVVKTTLKGNHKNASEAWERTYRYIEENGLEVNPQGQPFEMYITDPDEVDNPALWITEIYIPVK